MAVLETTLPAEYNCYLCIYIYIHNLNHSHLALLLLLSRSSACHRHALLSHILAARKSREAESRGQHTDNYYKPGTFSRRMFAFDFWGLKPVSHKQAWKYPKESYATNEDFLASCPLLQPLLLPLDEHKEGLPITWLSAGVIKSASCSPKSPGGLSYLS